MTGSGVGYGAGLAVESTGVDPEYIFFRSCFNLTPALVPNVTEADALSKERYRCISCHRRHRNTTLRPCPELHALRSSHVAEHLREKETVS
jgi:nitrate reductase cytochrome c-type subunit